MMRDLIMLYGITLGKRYTKKQKALFLEEVSSKVKENGYSVEIQTKKTKFQLTNNLIIGDLDNAEKVIVAAYDTPSKIYLPNYNYYPFYSKKNVEQDNLNFIVQIFFGFISIVISYFFLKDFNEYTIVLKLLSLLCSSFILVNMYFVLKGKPNQLNYNRNSVSIAILMSVLEELKDSKNIAFVLLDQNVNSFNGLRLLAEKITNQTLIVLDSLATGSIVVCAHKNNIDCSSIIHNASNLEIFDKSYTPDKCKTNALSICNKIVYLASGEMLDKQFVVKNTRSRKDYHVNIERVEKVKEVLIAYLRR
ncbi:MAG: hypothetical protein RSE56_03160 [Bacilli bacterium]|uniref:hypothetical protein n=1 Tax=Anaerorhabdus sp. TaxID=1872524 RepID=UPI002FC86180